MRKRSRVRPTIEDVAAKAGLSVSTVSLVLNNRSNVSKETRRRIQSVIADLNYHPQRSARGLASRSSGNIGFILTSEHFSLAEPFYTRIFLGSEFEARKHNYYILLTTVDRSVSGTKELPRFFLEHNVDGIIIAGKIGSSWIEHVRQHDLPLILIDYEFPSHHVSSVMMDNVGGARLVVEHLLKLGHSKIGFIGGDAKHPSIAARFKTYCDTLTEHGIEVNEQWVNVDEVGTGFENGYLAAQKILNVHALKPTAVFAANDAMALGCMKYCNETGVSVPGSLALVGFDNVESGLHVEPRLTTVNVHREAMGSVAVRRLVEMINENGHVVDKTTTPVELIVRESCGGRWLVQQSPQIDASAGTPVAVS